MNQKTPHGEKLADRLVAWLPDGPRIALKRRVRAMSERRKLARADLVVIGHPKSGNTWMRFQLARLYQHKYGLNESVIPDAEILHGLDPRIPQLHMGAYLFIRPHVLGPAPAEEFKGKAVAFIVRHPLDILVSLYFHVQKHALHERKLFNGWPLDLSDTTMFQFAEHPVWGLRQIIAFFNGCLRQHEALPRSLLVSYEAMRAQPAEALGQVTALVDPAVTAEDVAEAVAYTSFDRLRQAEIDNKFNTTRLRAANPKDPDSFKVRRAKVFGYKDYFSADEIGKLQDIIDRDLNPALGYGSAMHSSDPSRQPAGLHSAVSGS
jgi:hypothetical protein